MNRRMTAKPRRERTTAALVVVTGPEPSTDKDGQPALVWQVWAADADRNPVSRVYKCYGCRKARVLAAVMADERGAVLVDETKDDPNQDPRRTARRAYLLRQIGAKPERKAS